MYIYILAFYSFKMFFKILKIGYQLISARF